MRLKNDKSGLDDLYEFIEKYYRKQQRSVIVVELKTEGSDDAEGSSYYISFLLDGKNVIKYTMPMAIRTFPWIFIGVGALLVSYDKLMPENIASKISLDNTTEAIEHNLKLLDQYFKEQEEQQCREFCNRCKDGFWDAKR